MKASKKKEQIIETAKNLFMRFGVKRVTIEELCKEAGVSKVTFYKYFKNKLALAKIIKNELMDTGFAAFDDISALDISFLEKINRMTQWQMKFYSQMNNELIREFVSMKDVEDEYKKRFLKNIQNAQIKGEIRSGLNLELIYLMIKKLQEITGEGTWKNIFSDYSQYVEQVRTIIFFGLLTRSGNDDNNTKEQ